MRRARSAAMTRRYSVGFKPTRLLGSGLGFGLITATGQPASSYPDQGPSRGVASCARSVCNCKHLELGEGQQVKIDLESKVQGFGLRP